VNDEFAAASGFTLSRNIHPPGALYALKPEEIIVNPRTKIKTVCLYAAGVVQLEPQGAAGCWHQLSVMAAGCSTALTILDGQRPIFHFPVLQTGSFKMEAAFFDGLSLHISAAWDAPPHLTISWRVARS